MARPKTNIENETVSHPVPNERIPFGRFGQIRQANSILQSMGNPTRIGNLMNGALRQSIWDTSNLDRIDEETP